jgi:hypothetical protein
MYKLSSPKKKKNVQVAHVLVQTKYPKTYYRMSLHDLRPTMAFTFLFKSNNIARFLVGGSSQRARPF